MAAARLHERGDVVGERRAAPEMAPDEAAVDIHLGGVVHGSEVEHHVALCPACRDVDRALVPDAADEVRVSDAREFALRSERHDDLTVESFRAGVAAFQTACAEIECVGPFAVQVDPVCPFELRTGIFRAGNLRKQACGLQQEIEGDCGFFHGCFSLVCVFSGTIPVRCRTGRTAPCGAPGASSTGRCRIAGSRSLPGWSSRRAGIRGCAASRRRRCPPSLRRGSGR